MVRRGSEPSVDQPNPFKAMLSHLRGPQYVSPAPAAAAFARSASPKTASPKSPSQCTPVLLLPSERQMPGAYVRGPPTWYGYGAPLLAGKRS